MDYPGETSLKQIYGTFNRAMLRMIPALRSLLLLLLLLIYSFSVIFLTSAFLHLCSVHFFTPSLLFYCSSPFHSSVPHLLTCLQDVRGASVLSHGGVLPALPGQVLLLLFLLLLTHPPLLSSPPLLSFAPHHLSPSPRFTQDMQPHYVFSPREMTRSVSSPPHLTPIPSLLLSSPLSSPSPPLSPLSSPPPRWVRGICEAIRPLE